ncbi:MAG TPA: hypothetical protein VJ044_03170, partial [Candidatus Hodarchaeales archaeon]|nr:hypothetical protein [Candidatus Hodarchaeales archaeon]
MKTLLIRFGLILFVHPFVSYLPAQDRYDPDGTVRIQLMNLIQARYGSNYQYVGFSIFDSLAFYSSIEDENIQDPYGTLGGSILFSTGRDNAEGVPDTFVVGLVKNGQIMWDNAPGTNIDLGGDLLYAKDVNNDGDVDLLFSEIDREILEIGRGQLLYYLHILSWNGTFGRVITASRESIMGDGSFQLLDKDGDDIQEIRAALPDLDIDFGDLHTSSF